MRNPEPQTWRALQRAFGIEGRDALLEVHGAVGIVWCAGRALFEVRIAEGFVLRRSVPRTRRVELQHFFTSISAARKHAKLSEREVNKSPSRVVIAEARAKGASWSEPRVFVACLASLAGGRVVLKPRHGQAKNLFDRVDHVYLFDGTLAAATKVADAQSKRAAREHHEKDRAKARLGRKMPDHRFGTTELAAALQEVPS